jgi:hypothetical protein
MLEYEIMRSLMSLQGVAVFWDFSDLSQPWESLDRIYEEGLVVGWSTSIGYCGRVLATPKDKPKNYFRDLVWVPRLGFCPLTGQSRAVTGFLTGHNTMRRHLHLMELSDSPLCRCGAEDETSAHILCECEALASLRHAYLSSFFLEPEDIKNIILGSIWNFCKATGLQ